MKVTSNQFVPASELAILDPDLQQAVTFGTNTAFEKRKVALFADGYEHGQRMRQQAAEAKRRALNNLADFLEQAEQNMTANGMQVRWATDAAEANRHILEIIKTHQLKRAAKSKSMATEEIGLNHVLEKAGVEVIETDLGEFIVQLGNETPSHIVAPIVHKTKESIRQTLIEKAEMPPTDDVNEMTAFARQFLRKKFLEADLGITGGNFIIAETGSIGLVTNEGNARMVTGLPRVHIALVGIEKMVATFEDYITLTQVLPRSSTGQTLTVYTQLINGPQQKNESDGPEHVYVILLDNGRSRIYNSAYTESLACLRCGACLNGCPVYQAAGGHAYGWVYSGPIGAVLTPLFTGLKNATPLPHASSLCGTCKEVCPVDIDIPRMLLDLRHDLVQQNLGERKWNLGMNIWTWIHRSPKRYRRMAQWAKRGLRLTRGKMPGPLGGWTRHRSFPGFAPQTFMERYEQESG